MKNLFPILVALPLSMKKIVAVPPAMENNFVVSNGHAIIYYSYLSYHDISDETANKSEFNIFNLIILNWK